LDTSKNRLRSYFGIIAMLIKIFVMKKIKINNKLNLKNFLIADKSEEKRFQQYA
jgi:hypothetical protein